MMKKHRFDVACFFVLVLIGFSPAAKPSSQEGRGMGRLTGTVVDEAGNPIEGARISLEYQVLSNKLTAVSNSKGQWGFIGLGKGAVVVSAEKEGFVKSVIQLEVSGIKRNPEQKIIMKKPAEEAPTPGVSDASKETLLQGNALFEEKKFAEALALYQKFLDMNPALYEVRLNAANCLMELQEYDGAVAEYEKVLEGLKAEPPKKKDKKLTAQIFAAMGDAFLRRNRLAEAEEYFKKSMDIDPSDHALAYNVAEIMMSAHNLDEAIRYYEMAIGINPGWPKSYLKLGYAWLNKGNNEKAVESLKKFISLSPPDDPDVGAAKEIIKNISKTGG